MQHYTTKENDCLDWICWMHYFRQPVKEGLMQGTSRNYDRSSVVLEFLSTGLILPGGGDLLDSILNETIKQNPHLLSYGPLLPAGVRISFAGIQSFRDSF